jgi:hypothetical protein
MHGYMTLALVAALLATALPGMAHAAATPAPVAATPSPNPVIMARAKTFYRALATGTIDRSQLSAQANAKLTDEAVKAVAAKLAPLGEPVTFEYVKSEQQGGSMLHAYLLGFGNGQKLEFVVGFDAQDKVSALALQPAP